MYVLMILMPVFRILGTLETILPYNLKYTKSGPLFINLMKHDLHSVNCSAFSNESHQPPPAKKNTVMRTIACVTFWSALW